MRFQIEFITIFILDKDKYIKPMIFIAYPKVKVETQFSTRVSSHIF